MATETRWFATRIARLSNNPKWRQGNRRGFLPALLEPLEPAGGLGQPGTWFAHAPAMAAGLTIAAITWDTEKHPPGRRNAVWAKLKAAPDQRVFDVRDSLSTLEGAWTRRDLFAGILQSSLVDVPRFRNATKDIGHHFRELARALIFYGFLGRHFYPVALDATIDTIEKPGRDAMAEHLEEHGFPGAKLPAKTDTFRAFYRVALADAWADFGLDSGAWHLGHPNAHLRKQ